MPLYILTDHNHAKFTASDIDSAKDKFDFIHHKHPEQEVLLRVDKLKALHPPKEVKAKQSTGRTTAAKKTHVRSVSFSSGKPNPFDEKEEDSGEA